MDRRRVIAALLALGAVALAVAGLVVWREMSPSIAALDARCSGRGVLGCGFAFPAPHRLHPLRAELLWAGTAVVGILAVGLTLRPRGRHDRPLAASD